MMGLGISTPGFEGESERSVPRGRFLFGHASDPRLQRQRSMMRNSTLLLIARFSSLVLGTRCWRLP